MVDIGECNIARIGQNALISCVIACCVSTAAADAIPFDAPEMIPVTDEVTALASADINGDGRTDLVLAEFQGVGTGELLWLENSLSGWVRHSIQLVSPLTDLAVGDVNGDGALDLVASSSEANAIRWFSNENGDGLTWTSSSVTNSAAGVAAIKLVDIDRDGLLDLVAALTGVDEIRLWRQNSSGFWQERLIGTGAVGINDIAIGDIDRDGRIDVIGAIPGNGQIRWWANPEDPNTAPNWTTQFIGLANDPAGLQVADIDLDGALDVFVASRSLGIIGLWINNGNGAGGTWQRNNLGSFADPTDVQLADLDRDGDLDIAIASGQAAGGVAWLDNQRESGYALREIASGIQGAALTILDIEPDGDPDLVLGGAEAWQLRNRSPAVGARFGVADQVFAPLLVGSSVQPAVRIGRINDDARLDLLIGGLTPPDESKANALLNFEDQVFGYSILPEFVFSLWPNNTLPPRLTAPAIADFDRDGRNELLFGSNDNSADLTTMGVCANSAMRFEDFPAWDCRKLSAEDAAGNDLNASISGNVFSADIDRDGWPDLVAPTLDWLPFGAGQPRLQWFEHLEDFSDTKPFRAHEIAVGTFSVIALVDLLGNGRTDIVTGNRLFRNAADDGSSWIEQAPLPLGWQIVDVGDIDLDGAPDLMVVADPGQGLGGQELYWAKRDGPDWPTAEIDAEANCPCRLADMDRDGDLDVLAVDGDGAPLLIRNTFSPDTGVGWSTQPIFSEWALPVDAIHALDFSDDGLPELIVRSDTIEFFFTNQASTLNSEWTQFPPPVVVETEPAVVFEVEVMHAGRPGDPDIGLTGLRFELADAFDDDASALSAAELDSVVAELSVYRDDGDGVFDAGDALIAESNGGPYPEDFIALDAGVIRPDTTIECCDLPQRLFVEFAPASGAAALFDVLFLRPAIVEAVDVVEEAAVRVQTPPALRSAELNLVAETPGEEWLSVQVIGDGIVESSPGGIQCDDSGGTGCSDRFASGSTVTLTPVPPTGQLFSGWEGDCTGLGPCDLVMDATRTTTASFEPEGEGTVTVDIQAGSGIITSDPPRIQCPGVCSANFDVGSEISLIAVPDPGFEFDGWATAAFCPDTQSTTCTFTALPLQTIAVSFATAPDPIRTLTVTRFGQGTVTSAPAGIDCGTSCTADFQTGSNVVLTATADPGWMFDGWGDACEGIDPSCIVRMSFDKTVQPRFIPEPTLHRVTVSVVGQGQVQSIPAGIDCPGTCSLEFEEGTSLLLEQQAAAGFIFNGWVSSLSCGSDVCGFTVDSAAEVEARFVSTAQQFPLDVVVTGSGRVTSQPVGIDCPGSCSASFEEDSTVELFASPEPGFEFLGWTGACSGASSCTVTLDASRQVEAIFESINPQFELDVTRTGSGYVSSSPGGIDCGLECSASFDQGTSIELFAAPATGWRFGQWTGDCTGAGSCSILMNGARQVEAEFIPQFDLTITLEGEGSVVSQPAGIDCPGTCSATFDAGTQVVLTADSEPGWILTEWVPAFCQADPTCIISMVATRIVMARFEQDGDLVFRDRFE